MTKNVCIIIFSTKKISFFTENKNKIFKFYETKNLFNPNIKCYISYII